VSADARPALVLLHGLSSNATRWWNFMARTRLTGWKILRPNLRGYAGSSERGRIGMRVWSDDLARLLDAERVERAVVGGHCLGANLALNFAALYPQRASGLALIEPMPRDALAGAMLRLARWRFLLGPIEWGARLCNALGFHRRRIEPIDLERWDKAVAAGTLDLERYASPFSDLHLQPLVAYMQGLKAMVEPLPELSSIRCPVLALVSRRSHMTDPARVVQILRALPGLEVVELDAEHWIPTEQPEAMCRAIEDWIARKGLSS
jgi:pimeloyl-ACP methyl ester carboxylesterase